MSKHDPKQPPAYESIPLEPNPHGDQSLSAGFTCPEPSPGEAYPATQQPKNIIQAAPQSNDVHVQPGVVYAITPGPLLMSPGRVTCHSCHKVVTTRVEHTSNTQTHILAMLCCMLGLWPCCLCFVPYCTDSCMSANHFCPKCGTLVGQGVNI